MYQSAWKAVTPGTHDAGTCKAAKTNGGSTIGSLDATRAYGGALIDEQFAIAGNREFNPVTAVETTDAIGIVELGLDQVGSNPRESHFGRLSPMFGLIFEGDFVEQILGDGLDGVGASLQDDVPMEALGGIVLDVTLSFAYRLAIDKELHLGLIGIDEDLTGLPSSPQRTGQECP